MTMPRSAWSSMLIALHELGVLRELLAQPLDRRLDRHFRVVGVPGGVALALLGVLLRLGLPHDLVHLIGEHHVELGLAVHLRERPRVGDRGVILAVGL